MRKNYIGIREARINLSKLIRDVRSGLEITITDRGVPVARLVPVVKGSLSLEERIKSFEDCGLIEPCRRQSEQLVVPVDLPRKPYRLRDEGAERDG